MRKKFKARLSLLANSGVFLFVIMTLLCGAFLYATTRSEDVYLSQWIAQIGGAGFLSFFQTLFNNSQLPGWMIYSLPDGLWMLALTTLVLLIWDFKLHIRSIVWIIIAIVAGLLFEIFQEFQIVPGTFDIADLVLIFIAAFFPISFVMIKQYICATK